MSIATVEIEDTTGRWRTVAEQHHTDPLEAWSRAKERADMLAALGYPVRVQAKDDGIVEVGQKWRRKSDGLVVVLDSYVKETDDWGWRSLDGKRMGPIFGYNLRQRYERVPS